MLVSCILPTRDRREYIPAAIACFQAQAYPLKELVIVDNGDPIHDLVPRAHNITYIHAGEERLLVGAMRNLACQYARGEAICHWDDDDWSHPQRLREQAKLLIGSSASMVGYRSMYFADEAAREAWLYRGEPDYALGTSLLYHRSYWRGNRFRTTDTNGDPLQVGEDNLFIEPAQQRRSIVTVDAGDRMIARIHEKNTCDKREKGSMWNPVPFDTVQQILGAAVAKCA